MVKQEALNIFKRNPPQTFIGAELRAVRKMPHIPRQVSLLSSPFSSAQDGFKNPPKLCLELFGPKKTENML